MCAANKVHPNYLYGYATKILTITEYNLKNKINSATFETDDRPKICVTNGLSLIYQKNVRVRVVPMANK